MRKMKMISNYFPLASVYGTDFDEYIDDGENL